jgi:hypothetical protein
MLSDVIESIIVPSSTEKEEEPSSYNKKPLSLVDSNSEIA